VIKLFIGLIGLVIFTGVSIEHVSAIYDPLSVPNNKFGIHILEPTEIEKAAKFSNSSGGEWGYVTIPIRANDRDLEKWTKFMNQCRKLEIIPILRIAGFPDGDKWSAPNEFDLLAFANFLDQLPWPIKNRYVVVYNEPNHAGEWGGFVDPAEYARILDRAVDLFRQVNGDFFMISAGLDASQANLYNYYHAMQQAVPGVYDKVDGVSFHAYGNPGFVTAPNIYSRVNVASFKFEARYLKINKPIFITEAGWKNPADWFFPSAFTYAWNDSNIVAVTPFLLDGGSGPFADFSFVKPNGDFQVFAKTIMDIPKIKGQPLISESRILNLESGIKKGGIDQPTVNQNNFFSALIDFLRNLFL
jgi:hypothetical protein